MKLYKRNAVFTELKPYCHLASDTSFMEVCEWENGEGFDVTVNDRFSFSLTYGELDALIVLTKVKG